MKVCISTLFVLILSTIGYCQCPTSDIVFRTQSAIDSFSIIYPNCTEVNFNVIIGGETEDQLSDIQNLNGLSSITRTKNLRVQHTSVLQTLEGLENLEYVDDFFFIGNNLSISDLSGISSLDSCRSVSLGYNPNLQDFEILGDIDFLERLYLSNNPTLKNLILFPPLSHLTLLSIGNCDSLTTLNGINQFDLVETVALSENKLLNSLNGINDLDNLGYLALSNLDTLDNLNHLIGIDTLRKLDIVGNSRLVNLVGLDSLRHVDELYIGSNFILESLQGLNNLNRTSFLTIQSNISLLTLSGLDNLTHVNRIIIENNNRIKDLSGLGKLDQVKNSFEIRYNDELESLNGYSPIDGFQNISFHDCEGGGFDSFEDGLFIEYNPSLQSIESLSALTEVFGNLHITNNEMLTDLSGLENIKYIFGNKLLILGNENLENIHHLESLEEVGFDSQGDIEINGNSKIINLEGLNNLNTMNVGTLSIFRNENLVSLSGLDNLVNLSSLTLTGNPNLSNINALENLTTLNSLTIRDNNSLENLDAFNNLISTIHSLRIFANTSLYDISGLDNIEAIVASTCNENVYNGRLLITGNSLLGDCQISLTCEAIASSDVNVTISNNAVGCNSIEDVNCDDISISGFVYFDQNQNGLLDNGEVGIRNIGINMSPPERTNITKPGGKYSQVCQEGVEYNIRFPSLANYSLTTNDSYTILFESGNSLNYGNNFGIYPNSLGHDISTSISSNPTFCNRDIDFFISMENRGTIIENGKLRVEFDPLSSFSWSSLVPDSIDINSNFLLWNISDFTPFELENIELRFDMPDETLTGEILEFTSSFIIDSLGNEVELNEYTYSPTVLCSYDPNDKLVMPVGMYDENYTLIGERLTYTVRFQNTGNAPAIDVTIVDTINTLLDINTFRVVNSSFKPQTIIDDRQVTFLFKDINLVDSLSDERNSHGFVTFEIEPIEGIEDYSEISNTADIIFDFNAPIITNTVFNTMVTTFPTNTIEHSELNYFTVFPNPTSQHQVLVDFDLKGKQSTATQIVIINYLGEQLSSTKVENGINEVNIDKLNTGLYFVSLRRKNKILFTSKLSVVR